MHDTDITLIVQNSNEVTQEKKGTCIRYCQKESKNDSRLRLSRNESRCGLIDADLLCDSLK